MRRSWGRNVQAKVRYARHSLTPNNVIGLLLAICLVVTMYLAYLGYSTQQALQREVRLNRTRSAQNTQALCALRRERKADVARTAKFLDAHPESIINLGGVQIKRSQLVADQENMQETVNALSFVVCSA